MRTCQDPAEPRYVASGSISTGNDCTVVGVPRVVVPGRKEMGHRSAVAAEAGHEGFARLSRSEVGALD